MSFKRKLFTVFLLWGILLQQSKALAQKFNYLTTGTQLCDNTPYKLVFWDDFEGQNLDLTKWHTYDPCKLESSSFCTPGADDWEGARFDPSGKPNVGFKDQNVIVSGGTCKLQVKIENVNWKCGRCTSSVYAAHSSGMIVSSYLKYFNSGKFEAQIKMPTFTRAHSTFWIHPGAGHPNNEIDIAEAYGDPYGIPEINNNRYCNYSYHSWVPSHYEQMFRYPNQRRQDYINHRFFDQQNWHTYTCEWDPNVLKFYIDGNLRGTHYKYFYRKLVKRPGGPDAFGFDDYWVKVPVECTVPMNGYFTVDPAYPDDNNSHSNIQFTPYVDNAFSPGPLGTLLGEMEIDNVKVWQRHPEADGNSNLCAQTSIAGSGIICNTAPVTFSVAEQQGQSTPLVNWTTSSNLVILGATSSVTNITVQPTTMGDDWGVISHTYPTPCGNLLTQKKVDVGPPAKPNVTCILNKHFGYMRSFSLTAERNSSPKLISVGGWFQKAPTGYSLSPTTFEWNIDYGPGLTNHYHGFGQTVSTSAIPMGSSYDISWTLTVTNSCGSVTTSGIKTMTGKVTEDSSVSYFYADITDSAAYEQAVRDRLENEFVTDTTDTIAINTLIDRIRMEELDPYIVYHDSDSVSILKVMSTDTKLYPNPATHLLYVELGNNFSADLPIEVKITDIYGKTVQTFSIQGQLAFPVDLKGLPVNLYVIELVQNGRRERHKFSKI